MRNTGNSYIRGAHDLDSSLNIIRLIKSRRMRWVTHVAHTHTHTHTHIYIYIYRVSQEECARLRESFLMLKYTDITQNTYVQS